MRKGDWNFRRNDENGKTDKITNRENTGNKGVCEKVGVYKCEKVVRYDRSRRAGAFVEIKGNRGRNKEKMRAIFGYYAKNEKGGRGLDIAKIGGRN